jgi:hypothetical protein
MTLRPSQDVHSTGIWYHSGAKAMEACRQSGSSFGLYSPMLYALAWSACTSTRNNDAFINHTNIGGRLTLYMILAMLQRLLKGTCNPGRAFAWIGNIWICTFISAWPHDWAGCTGSWAAPTPKSQESFTGASAGSANMWVSSCSTSFSCIPVSCC